MSNAVYRICSSGLSPDDRAALASRLGMEIGEPGDDPPREGGGILPRRVLVFALQKLEELPTLLRQDYDAHVEWTDAESVARVLDVGWPDLAISVTTRCAYRGLTGRVVAEILAERGVIDGAVAGGMAEALQEALANSVIHGNLMLHQSDARHVDDFIEFHRGIAKRVFGAEGLQRRIGVHLNWSDDTVVVKVADEGTGFRPAVGALADPTRATGRGLSIMRKRALSVTHERDGRVICLTFHRGASA